MHVYKQNLKTTRLLSWFGSLRGQRRSRCICCKVCAGPGVLEVHGPLARYVKLRVMHAPRMQETLHRHRELAITTCITTRASRTCRDAYRDHYLAVPFSSQWRGKRFRHSRRISTRNFAYLVRGPWKLYTAISVTITLDLWNFHKQKGVIAINWCFGLISMTSL